MPRRRFWLCLCLTAAIGLGPFALTRSEVEAAAAQDPALAEALEAETLAVASPLDPTASIPSFDQIDALAAQYLGEREVGLTSISVRDWLTGEEIYGRMSERALIPASTTKVLSAAAALATLDPNMRLTTRAVLTRTGPASGIVTLVGAGDMMLAPDEGDENAVIGHAGIGDLARDAIRELRRRGVRDVTVALDDSLFSGSAVLPSWGWDLGETYGPPIAAVAVNRGRAGATFDASTYVEDPALVAAERFRELLAKLGADNENGPGAGSTIVVQLDAAIARRAPGEAAQVLAEVRSATVRQLTEWALEYSDNAVSEVLGRLAAIGQGLEGTFAGCTQAVAATLTDLGVDEPSARLEDCSGLSRGDAISATLETSLLVKDSPVAAQIIRGLPVGGLSGTLAGRFTQAPALGNVRAKTGTLTGVRSLAGVVQTAGGRQLVFSVVTNQPSGVSSQSARDSIDRFVSALAALG
jgi:D-alanyl-D-alanine carboxypeptidase/D-alanyl-D-alanine-endopeptidase (penicillin-binding protein 4)